MARAPVGPPPHGRLRSRGTQTCTHVPTMLAARANGALGEADLERLARHLDRCERCDAIASIFHRAELNYQDPPFDTLGTETSEVLLAALEAVPMQTIGVAPAPVAGAPAGETLDGAFGHLPDLEDEVPVEAEPEPEAEAEVEVEPEAEVDVEVEPEAAFDDELAYGETIEWDAPEHAAAELPAPALAEGPERRSARGLLVALPVVVVAAALVGVLFLAGVLGGGDGSPATVQRSGPTGIEAPVTTPLPVTVKAPAEPAATESAEAAPGTAASSATPAASGTAGDTAPGTAPAP
jgi:hypothetical protein